MNVDLLIHSARQLITCASPVGPKRAGAMRDVGLIEDGAIALSDGIIVAVGKTNDLRADYAARESRDATGKVVCPGLVDPHTHVVYAGDRVDEFEQRIRGATYLEIMAAGGGIAATVRSTRAASLDQIIAESRARLDRMLALGTTTAEIKSGYGLDTAAELKLLQAIEMLDATHPIDLVPTFMGAHAIPVDEVVNEANESNEWERGERYVERVVKEMTPAAADWYARSRFVHQRVPMFVDVFCERNAFDVEQSRRVLAAGARHGMRVKAHVDEFTPLGGVAMAIDLGAVSVDHLDMTGESDIARLAQSGAIAVVIPTVNFNLGSAHFANARRMIDAGAALALTTDINPGSAPCPSMPLVMAIACRYQRLSPAEALNASTLNAAHAVGLGDRIGSLEAGKQADLLIVDAPDYRE